MRGLRRSDMHCPKCQLALDIETILENSTESVVEASWIHFSCPNCYQVTPIELTSDRISSIKILGAPGPDWEYLEHADCPGLTIRLDPGFLHCWYGSEHYEFPNRV